LIIVDVSAPAEAFVERSV